MGYSLGIDLGTTYSAAALARDGGPVEVCTLGTTSQSIPSVVVLREDGEILTGDAAERRASSEPTRTAREFKRRLGDPVPMIIGTTPYGAEALMALLLRAIVAQVTEREGVAPEIVVLTHPANYSDYKRGLLEEAARLAGLDLTRVRLLSEPQAAAVAYASQSRVESGDVVAVYDFGGGTFDAAVVRKDEAGGFALLGSPEGMERLGGIDIDQAVLAHVDQAVDGMVTSIGSSDPSARPAVIRLRDEVREAKEALSTDTDSTIPVSLPGLQTEVRLTREELEGMIRPRVAETVDALRRAVASAGVPMEQVTRVLLVGGSSRIPLVGMLVRELTGRPVAIDAHPKLAIASGAAVVGAAELRPPEVTTAAGMESPASPGTAPGSMLSKPRAATLAAAAGAGFVTTAAGAAIVGATGGASAAGATTAASGATGASLAGVGPAGTSVAAGPQGSSLPGVGPTGVAPPPTPPAAPPGGPPPAAPPGAPRSSTSAARGAASKSKVPIAVAAAVGVAAAVVAVVAVTSGGDDDSSSSTDAPVAAVATTEASPVSTTPTTAPGGARGVTGATAIVAGLPNDNTGKGVPGEAIAASLGAPTYLTAASNGTAYVVDVNVPRVLRIKDGKITVAFEGSSAIGGLAVSSTGKVVALTTDGLVEITGDGQSTRVASLADLGNGVGPGQGTPLTFDGAGNLYIGNSNRYQVLRRSTDGTMSLVAGNGENGGIEPPKGDGGPATAAPLGDMRALLVDGKGNLLIGLRSGALRRVATDGTISTLAGAGATKLAANTSVFADDGTKASDLKFAAVDSLAVDAKGRVYVGDSLSGAVIRILTDGTMQFVAGDQQGTVEPETKARPANQTRVADAGGLAFDNTGALLVSEAGLLLRIEGVAAG